MPWTSSSRISASGSIGVVPRRDSGRDHDVAEEPCAALIHVVQREAQHVGRSGLVHVANVQILDLRLSTKLHRQLDVEEPLARECGARERAQRRLVDGVA